MNREYCCGECGLIWYSDEHITNKIICPECYNYLGKTLEQGIYACDTHSFYYSMDYIKNDLKARGFKIHYHRNHPWYYKNEKSC